MRAAAPLPTTTTTPPQRRRGMSLLEVLIAGAVFAGGAAGVISATSTYMNVMEHERKLTGAWRVLQGEAAHLRALPDTHPRWTSPSLGSYDELGRDAADAAATVFVVDRSPAAGQPVAGARQVTLTARWTERSGTRTAVLVVHR